MELRETHSKEVREARPGGAGCQEAEAEGSRIQDWPGLHSEALSHKQNHKKRIKQEDVNEQINKLKKKE